MPRREIEEIAVQKLRETDRAWQLTDGKNTDWFPKSICELEEGPNGMATLIAPIWILKEKGFI